eukprot:g2058.t1
MSLTCGKSKEALNRVAVIRDWCDGLSSKLVSEVNRQMAEWTSEVHVQDSLESATQKVLTKMVDKSERATLRIIFEEFERDAHHEYKELFFEFELALQRWMIKPLKDAYIFRRKFAISGLNVYQCLLSLKYDPCKDADFIINCEDDDMKDTVAKEEKKRLNEAYKFTATTAHTESLLSRMIIEENLTNQAKTSVIHAQKQRKSSIVRQKESLLETLSNSPQEDKEKHKELTFEIEKRTTLLDEKLRLYTQVPNMSKKVKGSKNSRNEVRIPIKHVLLIKYLEEDCNGDLFLVGTVVQTCFGIIPQNGGKNYFNYRFNDVMPRENEFCFRRSRYKEVKYTTASGEKASYPSCTMTASVRIPMHKSFIFYNYPYAVIKAETLIELSTFTDENIEFRPDICFPNLVRAKVKREKAMNKDAEDSNECKFEHSRTLKRYSRLDQSQSNINHQFEDESSKTRYDGGFELVSVRDANESVVNRTIHYIFLTPYPSFSLVHEAKKNGYCPKLKIKFFMKEPMSTRLVSTYLPLVLIIMLSILNMLIKQSYTESLSNMIGLAISVVFLLPVLYPTGMRTSGITLSPSLIVVFLFLSFTFSFIHPAFLVAKEPKDWVYNQHILDNDVQNGGRSSQPLSSFEWVGSLFVPIVNDTNTSLVYNLVNQLRYALEGPLDHLHHEMHINDEEKGFGGWYPWTANFIFVISLVFGICALLVPIYSMIEYSCLKELIVWENEVSDRARGQTCPPYRRTQNSRLKNLKKDGARSDHPTWFDRVGSTMDFGFQAFPKGVSAFERIRFFVFHKPYMYSFQDGRWLRRPILSLIQETAARLLAALLMIPVAAVVELFFASRDVLTLSPEAKGIEFELSQSRRQRSNSADLPDEDPHKANSGINSHRQRNGSASSQLSWNKVRESFSSEKNGKKKQEVVEDDLKPIKLELSFDEGILPKKQNTKKKGEENKAS